MAAADPPLKSVVQGLNLQRAAPEAPRKDAKKRLRGEDGKLVDSNNKAIRGKDGKATEYTDSNHYWCLRCDKKFRYDRIEKGRKPPESHQLAVNDLPRDTSAKALTRMRYISRIPPNHPWLA